MLVARVFVGVVDGGFVLLNVVFRVMEKINYFYMVGVCCFSSSRLRG